MLEGDGELLLWEEDGVAEHPVRAGSVVAAALDRGCPCVPWRRAPADAPHVRPREPGEVCYYPRSNKVYFIGLDLVTRVGEQLDYWEGEDWRSAEGVSARGGKVTQSWLFCRLLPRLQPRPEAVPEPIEEEPAALVDEPPRLQAVP